MDERARAVFDVIGGSALVADGLPARWVAQLVHEELERRRRDHRPLPQVLSWMDDRAKKLSFDDMSAVGHADVRPDEPGASSGHEIEWIGTDGAAARLGGSPEHVRRLVRGGQLAATQTPHRAYLFDPIEIETHRAERANRA